MKTLMQLLILLVFSLPIHGQSINPILLSSWSAEYKSTQFQVSSAMGEVIVTTLRADTIINTQGFFQGNPSTTSIIPSNSNNSNWMVFPNPVKDVLYIQSSDNKYPSRVAVFNLQGKVMYSNNTFHGNTIDLPNLVSGVYILALGGSAPGYSYFKIVKQY